MRVVRASVVTLLCLLSVAAAADVELRARAFRECRELTDRVLVGSSVEFKPEHREVLCEHYAQKADGELSKEAAADWLGERLRDVVFAWAPPGAQQKPGTVYRLPFLQWIPRFCSQAPGGATHREPENHYAFDFLMPIGSEVLAAREGVVAEVRDGTAEGLPWKERGNGNSVTILHRDGTFAGYNHLTPGIPVRVGQTVASGQLIARSGSTGSSVMPHLHFAVAARTPEGAIKAIPIRFSIPGRPSFEPEALHHHGVIPPSKRVLRLALAGEAVEDGEKPILFRYGDEAALRVELVEPGGTVLDVTTDGRMRYETMSPWNLRVPEPGRIQATAVPGVDEAYGQHAMPYMNQSEALLFVYHGVPKDPDFGFARLRLAIEVPPEAEESEAPATEVPSEAVEPELPAPQPPP